MDSLIASIQCGACLELLYEPLLLPCQHSICTRCYRPTANPICPKPTCQKPHLARNYGLNTLLQDCLDRLFPAECKAYALAKQGEASYQTIANSHATTIVKLPNERNSILGVILRCLDPAVLSAPHLQLPFVLRSQIYAELQLDNAFHDAAQAGYLNKFNAKGPALEKMAFQKQQKCCSKPSEVANIMSSLYLEPSTELPISLQIITQKLASICDNDLANLKTLFEESMFDCRMCLYPMSKQMPITTPCGHTFCKNCLLKSMENQANCPMCRSALPSIDFMLRRTTIPFLKVLFEEIFQLQPCPQASLPGLINYLTLPIIPGKLVFPGQTIELLISEPHDRVVVKNCLMAHTNFVTCLLETNGSNPKAIEYGCCMEITNFKPIMDSDVISTAVGNLPRFNLTCLAKYRVKIESQWVSSFGFFEGRVCRLFDVEPEDSLDWNPQIVAENTLYIRNYINQRRNLNCLLTYQYICKKYGNVPQDVNQMCYWLLNLLPTSPYILAEILAENTLQDRLLKTRELIQQVLTRCGKASSNCRKS